MKADFYLISTEAYGPIGPHKAYIKKKLINENNKTFLLLKLFPSLKLTNMYYENVIVTNRHAGVTIDKICQWPCYVYVCSPENNITINNKIITKDLEILMWGELYNSLKEAKYVLKQDYGNKFKDLFEFKEIEKAILKRYPEIEFSYKGQLYWIIISDTAFFGDKDGIISLDFSTPIELLNSTLIDGKKLCEIWPYAEVVSFEK